MAFKPQLFLDRKDNSIQIAASNNTLDSLDNIPKGYYGIHSEQVGFSTVYKFIKEDIPVIPVTAQLIIKHYIDLPELETLFSPVSLELHQQLGISAKVGLLFSGKQGTGKTTNAYAIAQYFYENHDAVIVVINNIREYEVTAQVLNTCKKEFGNFMSVIIFDECEGSLTNHENSWKSHLDSVKSITQNINLFCTNYQEDIPETIKERPSRIRHHLSFESLDDESLIFEILTSINSGLDDNLGLSESQIKSLVPGLRGQTFDSLKSSFINEVLSINLTTIKESESGFKKLVRSINGQ